jgi:cytochrome c
MKSVALLTFGLGLAAAVASVVPAMAAGDAANGEKIFAKCKVCHAIGPDAKNKVGPIMNGLPGRKSGTVEGYSYSDANKNSGITWDEATFKEYITAPRTKIPGTKMVFAGLPEASDRDDVWAYLNTFAADGSPKK